ncbi:MAG: outer membrane lipoprotein-sorting protein [Euryarchaeota archaeon]|nr:MAG: Outer-membrane lipoprotein carrier protein [ANME-2 cluster archaeon]MEA1865726.1 outer membrane lipoprotein-sorting protein [Euryarchaeota archaeon]
MKTTHLLLIAIATISLLISGCVSTDSALTGEQIAKNMEKQQDSVHDLSCTISIVGNTSATGAAETVVMEYAYKEPGMARMKYMAPSEIAGQVMVSNGTYAWVYNPLDNSVKTMSIPEQEQTDKSMIAQFVDELTTAYTLKQSGSDTVAGHGCYTLTATPTGMSMPMSMEIWVNKETWMPLKIETHRDGECLMEVEYQNLSVNTNISDDTFKFEAPEGATIESMDSMADAAPKSMTLEDAQATVTFEIKEPAYLPQGYEIGEIMAAPASMSEKSVAIVYTNNTTDDAMSQQLTAIQLAESAYNESVKQPSPTGETETVAVRGQSCNMTMIAGPFGETRVLQWHDSERYYILAGTLDQVELIKIAESI